MNNDSGGGENLLNQLMRTGQIGKNTNGDAASGSTLAQSPVLRSITSLAGIGINDTDGDHFNANKANQQVQIEQASVINRFNTTGLLGINWDKFFSENCTGEITDHTTGINAAEDYTGDSSGSGNKNGEFTATSTSGDVDDYNFTSSSSGGSNHAIVFNGNATEIEAPHISAGGFLNAILGNGASRNSGDDGGGMGL